MSARSEKYGQCFKNAVALETCIDTRVTKPEYYKITEI